MKKIFFTPLLLAWAAASPGQGLVNFANLGPGLNAPVYMTDGTTKVSTEHTAELLAGPSLSDMRSAATTHFLSGVPGYFSSGTVTISNVAPGATAFCLIQVWRTQLGDYTNAYK